VEIGHMAPLYCTALGKVLLAYGNYPLPETLEKRTERTITSTFELHTELETVKAQGYASDDEEFDPGVRCIAVPVFGINNKLAGAIGVSGPASRFTPEKLNKIAPQVIGVGKALSDRLKFKHEG
jgi:DNA-binding IclR family transcriptional regulator